VSRSARDALIASRGRTEDCPWKPEMIVDGNGIGHGFNEDLGEYYYHEMVKIMLMVSRS
jgi:hypothetical protein